MMKRISFNSGILAHLTADFPRIHFLNAGRILAAAVLFFAASSLSANQKTMILGGEKGWSGLEKAEGVTTGKGRFGYDAIVLASKVPAVDDDTELLINFDNGSVSELTGKFAIIENHLVPTAEAAKGKGAALSRGASEGLVLNGNQTALAAHAGLAGSFTVEFWIAPSLVENGERIYNWRSSMKVGNEAEYQLISATFSNNRMEWRFKNVFPTYKDKVITLEGYKPVVPGEWSRHTLSFDEETGCLEYLVNGKTEDIKYITSTDHENGTVCIPYIGTHTVLQIASAYTGKIDNIRIVNRAYEKDSRDVFATGNENFSTEGGRFVTQPILVSQAATLNEVDALMNVPGQTEVKLYVRSGDNCYGWSENYPEWKEITSAEEIDGVSGLYFQVAAELLPDGNGSKTPGITQLTLKYTEAELPLPPFSVTAEPGDGQVTLKWSYSVDDSAGGYYVYYGTRPGEYLGRVALEGASPIRAGNTSSITLTGLQNGAIYYFAVSSYSRIDGRINGELSKEVYARPSKRLAMER